LSLSIGFAERLSGNDRPCSE